MTNDELKEFYHEYLGKCVHENPKCGYSPPLNGEAWKVFRCFKCNEIWVPVPDYLSDPVVILGIIKEHVKSFYITTVGWVVNCTTYTAKSDKSLERAVMLALKAKVGNDTQ